MTKGNKPNPYDQHRSVGASGAVRRALVVNVMDPQKAGRVQIREVGHMEDEQGMPDNKLPWVKIQGSTSFAGMQGATDTHGLMPGSMVYVNGYGEGGQDIVITGTVGNDEKGENQSIHPATQGKGATDKVFSNDDYKQQKHAFSRGLRQAYTSTTTREARQNRKDGRPGRINKDPVQEGIESRNPVHYGERKTPKDAQGGTIGTSMYDNGPNAQKYIQDMIQNKSAIIPNALDAMEKLKKVTGNPTSIQSIGAGNFSAIMGQLKSLRSGSGQQKDPPLQYDCEYLKKVPDEQLPPDLLAQKRICELLDQELDQEQQDNANV